MSRRLAVLAALLLSCASFSAQAAPNPTAPTDADRKEFHDALISSSTMRGLMEADPAGFKTFEDGLLNDLATGKVDENGARKRGYDFATSARAKLMSALTQAPDDDYLAFVNAQLATMKLFGQYNTRACYEFVENSGVSEDTASTLGPALLAQTEKVGEVQLAAARAGAKTPVKRSAPTDKEAEAAVQSYVDLGGDAAWLRGLGDKTTDKLTPENRCDSAIKWIEAILAQPKPVAVRLMVSE
jgi:hypothetical protein